MSRAQLQTIAQFLAAILAGSAISAAQPARISIGFVALQTVAVAADGSGKMSGGVIVRFVNSKTRGESLVLTGTEGFELAPLRPGNYCYDAFSQKGAPLTLKRPTTERCFSVRADETVEVGVEFRK